MRVLVFSVFIFLIAACQAGGAGNWTGRWQGVEGTFLEISPAGYQRYDVGFRDLDGYRVYPGRATDKGIAVNRGGEPLLIKAGNGDATGMKWLAGKGRCLVVAQNEGYCRD